MNNYETDERAKDLENSNMSRYALARKVILLQERAIELESKVGELKEDMEDINKHYRGVL